MHNRRTEKNGVNHIEVNPRADLVQHLAGLDSALRAAGLPDGMDGLVMFFPDAHPDGMDMPAIETIFMQSEVGLALLDYNFNFVRVNPAYALPNGQVAEDFPGNNYFDLFPGLSRPIFEQVIKTNEPHFARHLPFRSALHPEKEVSYWDWHLRPVRAPSGVTSGLLLARIEVEHSGLSSVLPDAAPDIFEHFFLVAPYPVILIDETGSIQTLNHQAEISFGYSSPELIGKSVDLVIATENQYKHTSDKFYQQGQSPTAQLYGLRKGGARFPVETRVSTTQVEHKTYLICVIVDITERVKEQHAASIQAGYVRLLQDVAVASNSAQTLEGVLQFALDRVCAHTGWPVGHAIMLNSDGTLLSTRLWHLDDPQSTDAFRNISETMEFNRLGGLPARVMRRREAEWVIDLSNDPDFRRVEQGRVADLKAMFAFPIMIGNQPTGLLEFFSTQAMPPDEQLLEVMRHVGTQLGRVVERDQSQKALQRSEARFRAIFEESAIGIQLNDLDGYFVESNPALQHMLGYTATELRELVLTEITHPDDREANWEILKNLLRGDQAQARAETRYLRKDGSLMWAQISVSLVYDYQNRPQFVITLVHDISQQKAAQAEVEELRRRLQDRVEDERLRLAMELHDGPLQNLYGASFYLQETLPTLKDSEAEQSMLGANDIVQNVIDALRQMVGELRPPTLIPFGLEKTIRSHMDRWQQKHPDLNVHLELMRDSLRFNQATRLMLFRAYQQLLSNVERHAGAHNMWVRLKIEPEQVILEVQDDGQGFERPESWLNMARIGHTGLLVVSERAEDFGGRMEIDSHDGRGTLVRVILPYQTSVLPEDN